MYRSGGHGVVGYIAEPRRHSGTKLPSIILNRGGYLEFGAWNHFRLLADAGSLATSGFVVIATQYSGTGASGGKDAYGGKVINDVLILRRVLARHTYADANNIGMVGASRGGLMTYLALARVKWIKAAVVVAGLANLKRNQTLRPEMKKVFKEAFGGSKEGLRKRSAVCWAEKFCKSSPLLQIHGTADERVSPLDSLELSTSLIKNGVHHRLVLFENGDHFLTNFSDERFALTIDWLDRHLKNTKTV